MKEPNAVCQVCGKPFHVKPSALKHTKYCSKACHDTAQFQGKVVRCATCGKQVRVSPSLLAERNFCTNECRLKWLSIEGHSAGHKTPHLTAMKIETKCDACGKTFLRYPSRMRAHNFCSAACARRFTSARMADYNRTQNPKNTSAGWSQAEREAVRARERSAKGACRRDVYPKFHGQHEHRAVAEMMLGRRLLPGEVVHHINGDKHDNRPENLMVFPNQQAHVAYHAAHPEESGVCLGKRGGGAT